MILTPDQWQIWLTAPLEELYQFDRPFPADAMSVEATKELWARR